MNSPMTSQTPSHRIASILAVSVLALGLSACGRNDDATVGQRMDSTADRTEQAAADTRANTESTAQSAGDRMEQSAANAQSSAQDMASTAKDAIDDATITAQVNASLAKDPDLSAVKIDVDTVNGTVTLNGPAPSTVARDRAETIAKAVTGVTSVNNQLVVTSG